jgi:hypothetical protein
MDKEPTVEVEGASVIIDGHYEIELHQIDTHEKLLRWIFHLSQKTWMTATVIRSICEIASSSNEWNLYGTK